MPGGDRTGPMGMGPMTGRAAGYCAGFSVPGYTNPLTGRGFGWNRGPGWGRGRGMGLGRGRWAVPCYRNAEHLAVAAGPYGGTPTQDQELEMLRSQQKGFQSALENIQHRISELESGPKK